MVLQRGPGVLRRVAGDVRIDANDLSGATGVTNGTTDGLPQRMALYQDTAGTITFDCNATDAISVDLRHLE